MPTQKIKSGSRGGRPGRNDGPARQRYWSSGRLRDRKIAAMRANGFSLGEATLTWNARGRRKK